MTVCAFPCKTMDEVRAKGELLARRFALSAVGEVFRFGRATAPPKPAGRFLN
jgi:hypothetical protein